MDLSPAGAAFVRAHEGFVDHWYADPVGIGTIGIGFTWASEGFREWWDRNRPGQKFGPSSKMTREEADKCLRFVCAMEYGKAVNDFLGKPVKQHVFDGMTSPVFNLGPGSLKWKWAAAAKEGDLPEAAKRLRTTGTTAQGKPLKGLFTRRREEADLLQNGDYTIGDHRADPLADGMLIRGERGKPVTDLQTRLKARGFYTGEVDGIFGYGTEAAVLEFQRAKGLVSDGYAGPKTLAVLNAPAGSTEPPIPIPPKPTPETQKPDNAKRTLFGLIAAAILTGLGMLGAVLWDGAIIPFVNWFTGLFT